MEELVNMIGNFGFPIVVAGYLLVRIESKLTQLTESIHELTTTLKSM